MESKFYIRKVENSKVKCRQEPKCKNTVKNQIIDKHNFAPHTAIMASSCNKHKKLLIKKYKPSLYEKGKAPKKESVVAAGKSKKRTGDIRKKLGKKRR